MKPQSGPFLRWEKGEVTALKRLTEQGKSLDEIVAEVNRVFGNDRTRAATYRALQRYGKDWNYNRVQGTKWKPDELAILAAYYRKYGVRGVQAVLEHEGFHRSTGSIYSKASKDRALNEVGSLARFKRRRSSRPTQRLLIMRRALENALRVKKIVDIREEVAAYTNSDLATVAIAAKQLIKEGAAIEVDKDLIALPIKEERND